MTTKNGKIVEDASKKLNLAERLANGADLRELNEELNAEIDTKVRLDKKVNAMATIAGIIAFGFCCYLFWG